MSNNLVRKDRVF